MTTLAINNSVTVAVRDGGIVAIATNGGLASAVVTLTEGGSQTVSLGPLAERRILGPYGEGASIVITNSSCGAFDYDVETRADLSRIPYVLAQTGVPVILPSSGSSNASGQITLTTALPYQPSGAVLLLLPASVVVGDSTGGLYSVVFSSTTVAQIVGSPVTANAAYTQTTSAVTLASTIVPGGAMGANGSLRIAPQWSMPSNANVKTALVTFGGTTISSLGSTTIVQDTRDLRIRNRGSQSINVGVSSNATFTFAPTYATIDTSISQALLLRAQLAAATDYMILESYGVEVVPAA